MYCYINKIKLKECEVLLQYICDNSIVGIYFYYLFRNITYYIQNIFSNTFLKIWYKQING